MTRSIRKGLFLLAAAILLCHIDILSIPIQSPATSSDRIDINMAAAEELQKLPGIGPVIAARIVEYRRRHGRFKRTQDIIIVRGMSAGKYRQIAHLIKVS